MKSTPGIIQKFKKHINRYESFPRYRCKATSWGFQIIIEGQNFIEEYEWSRVEAWVVSCDAHWKLGFRAENDKTIILDVNINL